jgi:hypothetical protein
MLGIAAKNFGTLGNLGTFGNVFKRLRPCQS